MVIVFPDKLKVIFNIQNDRKVEDPVYILMTIFATEKNDYHIGAMSYRGQVVFTKKYVKEEIDFHFKTGLMDYKSKLEECKETVKLRLLNKKEINGVIEAHKMWLMDKSRIQALESTKNFKYEPKTLTVKLDDSKYAEEKTVVIKTKLII